jgi:microcompartment protein CcmK/EutM
MLDAQVRDDTCVLSASMDEIVLGRGLAARQMANPQTGTADVVVLGVKDPLSVEQVKARGGSPKN